MVLLEPISVGPRRKVISPFGREFVDLRENITPNIPGQAFNNIQNADPTSLRPIILVNVALEKALEVKKSYVILHNVLNANLDLPVKNFRLG